MGAEDKIFKEVCGIQRDIEAFCMLKVLPRVIKGRVRETRHFKEWWSVPMNYIRMVEIPLTIFMLDLQKGNKVLDISSPKLLPFYLGANGFPDITVSDISDYFTKDFRIYSKEFGFSPRLEIFDATRMPFGNSSLDRIFSVSVLEHVPDDGDRKITAEAARVLKDGGVFVITLPAGIAYMEEWLKRQDFAWPSETREDGKILFQRRYDKKSLYDRFEIGGLAVEDMIFIAEKPIKEPEFNENGRLLFNYYYLEDFNTVKIFKKLKKATKIPLLLYALYRYYSSRYQYLTRDEKDRNIREVAVKLRKKGNE